MPELRHPGPVSGFVADFRPLSSGDGHDPVAKRRGDHHTGDHVYRTRRNGLPAFVPYVYRGLGYDQYADQYGEDL
jgi:hypothetical protein